VQRLGRGTHSELQKRRNQKESGSAREEEVEGGRERREGEGKAFMLNVELQCEWE